MKYLAILALPLVVGACAAGDIRNPALSCVHQLADHQLALSDPSKSPAFVERTRLNWVEACGLNPVTVLEQ